MKIEPIVLIVDDEQAIRKFLKISLSHEGFQVIEAETAAEGIRQAASYNPSIILLDLGLPDSDGLTLISKVREWSAVPIIVLSARGKEDDKVKALDLGANDYLTKPFGVKELLARMRVGIRTASSAALEQKSCYEFGSLFVDFELRKVHLDKQEVHLTPTEYALLSVFVRNAGKVITHRQLLKEVWGAHYQAQSQYLRVFINQLRQKIEKDTSRPKFILTEPGIGYRFVESA